MQGSKNKSDPENLSTIYTNRSSKNTRKKKHLINWLLLEIARSNETLKFREQSTNTFLVIRSTRDTLHTKQINRPTKKLTLKEQDKIVLFFILYTNLLIW